MNVFPLQSLLNIPSEGITIVVDNAHSPQDSLSFLAQSRQQKRQRTTSSPEEHTEESSPCSALPPPPLVTLEDAMGPCRAGSFLRASAFHEMVDQSTLRRTAPCSFSSQMNFQWDAVQSSTNRNTMKPNPLLQKTSSHPELVPVFIRQDLRDMTVSDLIQKAIDEVSNQ